MRSSLERSICCLETCRPFLAMLMVNADSKWMTDAFSKRDNMANISNMDDMAAEMELKHCLPMTPQAPKALVLGAVADWEACLVSDNASAQIQYWGLDFAVLPKVVDKARY